MKKLVRRSGMTLGILVMVGVVGVPSFALARNAHATDAPSDGTTTQTTETTEGPVRALQQQSGEQQVVQTTETKREELQQKVAQERQAVQTRLQDAKLRVCQAHEKAITTIMTRISERGQKQADLFGTIAERVETFYVSQGKPLDTYDTLVANVASKKVAAQSAIDAIKASSGDFQCTGENPRGAIQGFKDALKSEITALKNYRTSVKNLIVGVKSVQGTTDKEAN